MVAPCWSLISVRGCRGRDVEEHSAVSPGRDPGEIRLPSERFLPRVDPVSSEHGGHLARPRDCRGEVPVYLAPLQPQNKGRIYN